VRPDTVDSILLPSALALLVASALGAALPLFRRWSERGLHLFVALSAGIFLGTIFFHLLPHLAGVGFGAGDGHLHGDAHLSGAAHLHDSAGEPGTMALWPWGAALLGILLLFLIEKVWLPAHTQGSSSNPHALLWSATFLGLGLHALTEGIALSAVLEIPEGRSQFLLSVLVHKATECFSLASVMRLAGLRMRRAVWLLALFALIEPAGLLLGGALSSALPALGPILTGFACGTFLYVAVADLLPEVFHGAGSVRTKVAAVLIGSAIPTLTLGRLEMGLSFARSAVVEAWDVFLEMAPFLLLGFAIAGIVRLLLKPERVVPKLGGNDLRSVGWAALIGAPLPLCSCSVVPVALSLRKAGASKGATAAFAVATPETGIDSIGVTWALLDPLMTIARPIGALISAVTAGTAVNWLVRSGRDSSPRDGSAAPGASAAACCAHEVAPALAAGVHGVAPAPAAGAHGAAPAPAARRAEDALTDHARHAHADPLAPSRAQHGFLRRALRYGFVEMLDDLAPSLLVGVLLSGAIVAALPLGALDGTAVNGWVGYLLMLVIGVPTYVCASASTPIAAALVLRGLSPGAAFVFLLVGPATNMSSLALLSRALGWRVVAVQVVALSLVAVALGWVIDLAYPALGIVPRASLGADHEHLGAWISYGSAALLAALLLASLVRTHGSRDLLAALRERPTPA